MEIVEMGKLSLKTRLSDLSPETTQHSIYRVPRHLRDVKNKAYQPQIVAIGPYHRGKPELKEMEEVKLRYMQALLKRKSDVPLERYISAVKGMAEKAHKCYVEPPMKLDPGGDGEFTDMLLLDGCFIIEVIQYPELFSCTFPDRLSYRILQQDLILLENQIPLFVLCKLFDLIQGPNQHSSLMQRVLIFCDVVFPERILYQATTTKNSDEVKHILDLIHINLCPSDHHTTTVPDQDSSNSKVKHILDLIHINLCPSDHHTTTSVPDQDSSNSSVIPSASELKVANVKFYNKKYHCPSDPNNDIVTILKKDKDSHEPFIFQAGKCTSLFDVEFTDSGKMLMPRLVIDDGTESFLRNLIAYEQLFPMNKPTYVTDYATLLDRLINTSKDVQILCGANIIKHMLGSEEAVVDFVNRLTNAVIIHEASFVYADKFRRINLHRQNCWNKAVAALRRDYFNTPWSYIAFVAALMLFLFTAAQTIFSALQMF